MTDVKRPLTQGRGPSGASVGDADFAHRPHIFTRTRPRRDLARARHADTLRRLLHEDGGCAQAKQALGRAAARQQPRPRSLVEVGPAPRWPLRARPAGRRCVKPREWPRRGRAQSATGAMVMIAPPLVAPAEPGKDSMTSTPAPLKGKIAVCCDEIPPSESRHARNNGRRAQVDPPCQRRLAARKSASKSCATPRPDSADALLVLRFTRTAPERICRVIGDALVGLRCNKHVVERSAPPKPLAPTCVVRVRTEYFGAATRRPGTPLAEGAVGHDANLNTI